jgi:signal transduction histidine kinase
MILRPIILDDLGLDAALEWMLEQQASVAGWTATYEGDVDEQRFAGDVETACFRIAQEALTNAARYAQASKVRVSLKREGDELLLEVTDDGQGFDLAHYRSPEERSKHFGLMAMEQRASLVGAQLAIESEPGRGTQVKARFPVAEVGGSDATGLKDGAS